MALTSTLNVGQIPPSTAVKKAADTEMGHDTLTQSSCVHSEVSSISSPSDLDSIMNRAPDLSLQENSETEIEGQETSNYKDSARGNMDNKTQLSSILITFSFSSL